MEQSLRGGRGGRPAPTPDQRWSKSVIKVVKRLKQEVLLKHLVAQQKEDWLVVKKVEHTLLNVERDLFGYNTLIQYYFVFNPACNMLSSPTAKSGRRVESLCITASMSKTYVLVVWSSSIFIAQIHNTIQEYDFDNGMRIS